MDTTAENVNDKTMLPEDPNSTSQSDLDRSVNDVESVKKMKKNNIKSLLSNPATKPKVIGLVVALVFFSAAGIAMVKRHLNNGSEDSGLHTVVTAPSTPGYEATLNGSSSKIQESLKSKEDEMKSKEALSSGGSFVQTPNTEVKSNPLQSIDSGSSLSGNKTAEIIQPAYSSNYQAYDDGLQQQKMASLKAQSEALIASWSPPIPKINQYQLVDDKSETAAFKPIIAEASTKIQPAVIKHQIKIGDLFYGRTDLEVSSDDGLDTTATILSGPYKGATLVGQLNVGKQGSAGLSYSIMSTKLSTKSIVVKMVAIDPNTNKKSLPADVDNHYMQRYGLLLASSFISGFSDATARTNTTVTTGLNGTSTAQGALTPKDRLIVATGSVGKAIASEAIANMAIGRTVTIKAGQEIALMALSDVEFEEAAQ